MIADPLGEAVSWVRDGGLLAYPTETVWGLGADAVSASALERLRDWKQRSDSEPISILVTGTRALESLGIRVDAGVEKLAGSFWPGPLTLVVACRGRFAPGVARDDGAVGVRCSAHPLAAAVARRLASEGAGPLTATSLNRSGEEAARTRLQARALCGERADEPRLLDVEGAEAGGNRESTVVDLTGERPRVLRWGALPAPVLDPVLREIAA